MTDTSKVTRIKVENTCVKDNTGKKRSLVFKEQPRDGSRCFFTEKFCVDEDGNLIEDNTAKSINHERIQLRLDSHRDGTGNPVLDADFIAYNAETHTEKKKTHWKTITSTSYQCGKW